MVNSLVAQCGPRVKPFASSLQRMTAKLPEKNISLRDTQSRRVILGQILAVLTLFPKRAPAQEIGEIGEAIQPPKSDYQSSSRSCGFIRLYKHITAVTYNPL